MSTTSRLGLAAVWRIFFLTWFVLLLGWTGCLSDTQQRSTGGETHFLTLCSSDNGACGGELSCLCGACSLPCQAQASCGAYAGAECVPADEPGACGLSTAVSRCEVRCITDADCAPLSAGHRCGSGFCRAAANPPRVLAPLRPTPTSDACAPGDVGANEVLILGDSFFALSRQVPEDLAELARLAEVLAAGESYRDASRLTNNALALMSNGIGDQYATAAAEAPPKVVVMTGGGADALLGSCEHADAECPLLVAATAAVEALLSQMAQDGVAHVVYVFYPNPLDAAVREKLDALRPLIQNACNDSPVPCHWLDLLPSFDGRYDDYILADGLNPTPAGARVVAEQIWALIERECLAQ